MLARLNKHFYKSIEFYAGLFLTLIWSVSLIHSSSVIDMVINVLFFLYSLYCIIHSLFKKG